MGLTNSNKELSTEKINCNETFKVKLSLTAEPDITSNPADIVLVLDRSGSMQGQAIDDLKVAANAFIDIIEEATDGVKDGIIGNGSHIGIVSFADTAVQDTQLITSVSELKEAIDHLVAYGSTNHADAFTKSFDLFDMTSTNQKFVIMFTDGKTTTGSDPNVVATQIKNAGISIYCIGLLGDGGIDQTALNNWASDPDSAYVIIAPTPEELEEAFKDLANNITKPGATDIIVRDVVNDCFKITALSSPTKGTASIVDEKTVQWEIPSLGTNASEGATFEFTVEHIGPCSGEVEVNNSITYTDNEQNVATFPNPLLQIDCSDIVYPEDCPLPSEFSIPNCGDSIQYNAGDVVLESLGRVAEVDFTLRNICPNRRVAVAVMLNEVMPNDVEIKRGMKVLTIPAHNHPTCQDVLVKCIKFVLPEETATLCNERVFRVRMITHYIDYDYNCCDTIE